MSYISRNYCIDILYIALNDMLCCFVGFSIQFKGLNSFVFDEWGFYCLAMHFVAVM